MAPLIIVHTACIITLKRKNTDANLNVMRNCHGVVSPLDGTHIAGIKKPNAVDPSKFAGVLHGGEKCEPLRCMRQPW
jgi:hypothetical protein